jgi:hypothetical protein
MTKRFVVRQGMTLGFGFELYSLDLEREKVKSPIIYDIEVPDDMTLSKAIELYKAGVRAKPKVDIKKRKMKPLAEILRLKREHRKQSRFGYVQDDSQFYEEDL